MTHNLRRLPSGAAVLNTSTGEWWGIPEGDEADVEAWKAWAATLPPLEANATHSHANHHWSLAMLDEIRNACAGKAGETTAAAARRVVDERAEASRRQIARLESVVGPLDDSGEWEPNEADLRAAADAIAYDDREVDEQGPGGERCRVGPGSRVCVQNGRSVMEDFMLRVALAGPSSQLERCEDASWALRKFAVVTEPWPEKVRRLRDAGISDAMLSPTERLIAKRECECGIREAHVVLWLAGGSEGASWECGFADALGKPIVVAGTPRHPIYGETIEDSLRFDDDATAIAYLRDEAKALRAAARVLRKVEVTK